MHMKLNSRERAGKRVFDRKFGAVDMSQPLEEVRIKRILFHQLLWQRDRETGELARKSGFF